MNELAQLADLLRQRNAIDSQISALIGRPSITGHLGEFIAARLFIYLMRLHWWLIFNPEMYE